MNIRLMPSTLLSVLVCRVCCI